MARRPSGPSPPTASKCILLAWVAVPSADEATVAPSRRAQWAGRSEKEITPLMR